MWLLIILILLEPFELLMNKIILNREKIIYILIFLNPIYEIIFSFLYRQNIELPLNQFLRIGMFILFLCFVKSRKTINKVLRITVLFLGIWVAQILSGISEFTFSELVFFIKLIYATSLIYIFYDFLNNNIVSDEGLIKAMCYSTIIIIVSVCLSPFGLGYTSWDGIEYRNGYTGWFLFGNYLTVILLIVLGIMLSKKYIKYRWIYIFFVCVTLVLLGNKAGIVGIMVYFIAFAYEYLKKQKRTKRKILILLIVFFALICMTPYIYSYLRKFIINQIALFKLYGYDTDKIWGTNSITSFLLSNRNLQLYYIDKYYGNINLLLGHGYTNVINLLNKYSFKAIEMDLYALLYYTGIIPLIVWIYTYIRLLVKMRKETLLIKVTMFVLIAHSVMTGHVIFESMSIVYFAIIGAIILKNGDLIKSNIEGKNTL